MQKKGANISLKGYDDIFSTDQSRAEAQQERVQEIPLSELHPFEGHPFRVVDDEEMMKTAESVRDFGVLTPAIVRPDPDGGYEIVSGHRRHRASELAGKETMPAIVRDLDDDAAIILMVDANLQRESILPSERAFAYKMKLDAIKHQGQRTDLTSSQVGMKLQAMDIVGQEAGESRNQVHRYIRLTELIPELLDMVDTGQIKFNPAVELSYLASEEQKDFLSAMDYAQAAPSLSQAQRIKKLAQEGECTLDAMCEIMNILDSENFTGVAFGTTEEREVQKEQADTMNVLLVKPFMYPQAVQIGCELEDLQKAVGGDIEATYPFNEPVALVMHDEGKLVGKELNRALRDDDGDIYDIIAGDFLVVGLGEDDFCSLSPELMKQFEEHFHQPETFVRMERSIMALPLPDDMVKKEDAPVKADSVPHKSNPDRDVL